MPDSSLPVDEVFDEALRRAVGQDRVRFLEEICGGDLVLRERVERRLRAFSETGSLLEMPAPDPSPTVDQPIAERPGGVIGPYKLIEPIGEGGMGTVWMAQQTEPVKRLVAVKLIKAGMDSKQVIARFEAERQALALMDHPNIARVLDGGATAAGRPYFVMDLVKGAPITRYCDEHHLTPRQRLELFIPVCQAVQHAHQKGIIHRDLKPSNVLIALYDGKPVPKVIDFGVAKAAGQPLTEQTLVTGFGAIVGTLEYVSPEQAEINQLDIDTRSDIYSLGVLLYELLTGSPPFTRQELEKAGMLEMLRVIREREPSKPSTKLSTAEGLPTLAANRGTEPAKLTRLDELDWIVMKALEKDRNRRYETANGFAMDVRRYLADEAVLACPPSAAYRLRKFARRHQGALMTAALVSTALVVGAAISLGQAFRATRAETTAVVERDKALAEKVRADEEAAIARAVNDFLQKDLLGQAAPAQNARDKQVTVEELLERAAAGIAGKFGQQPRIEAAIRQTIGNTYAGLGGYPAAQPHLERALELRRRVLGEEHPDTLASMNDLALLYKEQGQFPKAEPLFVQVLEVRRRILGEEHQDTLSSMNNLGYLYEGQGQYAKAKPFFVQTLEGRLRVLGEEHPDTLISMNNLAFVNQRLGQFVQAEALFVKTLAVRRRVLGNEHPGTLISTYNLATQYQVQGAYAKAEQLHVQALEARRRVLGEEHPETLTSMSNLALLYQSQGQFARAEPLVAQTLAIRRHVLGEDHPDTLVAMNNLALQYWYQREYAKAEPLYVKVLEAGRRVLGEEHPNTLNFMGNLALLYESQGHYPKAEPLLRETLEKRRNRREDGPVAVALSRLGWNWLQQQKHAEAEPLLRESLNLHKALWPDAWTTFSMQWQLGASLLGQKKYAKAEPLLLDGYEGMKQREAKIPHDRKVRLSQALERLIRLYDEMGQKDKADVWRQKSEANQGIDKAKDKQE